MRSKLLTFIFAFSLTFPAVTVDARSVLGCGKYTRALPFTHLDQGFPPEHLENLAAYSEKNRTFLAIRKPNTGSFRYHGTEGLVAKPMRARLRGADGGLIWENVRFKSATKGRFHGLVVKPSVNSFDPASPEYMEALRIWNEDWPKFSRGGFTLDMNGVVRDIEGIRYFSDYDLVLAFNTDGVRKSFGRGGDEIERVREELRELNEAVGESLFRHDGYYEAKYFNLLKKSSADVVLITPWGESLTTTAAEVYELFRDFQRKDF